MNDSKAKIKTLRELLPIVKKLKSSGKKIVLGHGDFDLMHYGHMYYLEQSKALGDVLIVSVVKDKFIQKGSQRPLFNYNIRVRSLAFLECVDYAVPCNEVGPYDIIKKIKPHIYTKGEEAAERLKNPKSGLNKDKFLVESAGGKLQFTKSIPIHSTELLKKYAKRHLS